jgi:hypothetical protein
MRLSTMLQEEWTKVAPYIDTLCLPVYRVSFLEKKMQLGEKRVVEEVVERVERALTGRLFLLPAIAYEGRDREAFISYINSVLADLARSAFHHLVVVLPEDLAETIDGRGNITVHPLPVREEATETEIDEWAEALKKRVIGLWQMASDEIAANEED